MANYYLDFVGLNTFIYEPVGYDSDSQSEAVAQNILGISSGDTNLSSYKNNDFSHNLSTTASFFPALMIKRNGPYGYNSFKQVRVSENPLSRKQRKENIFTMVEEPGPETTFRRNGKITTVRGKYGSILKYDEVPVTSRFKPFTVIGQVVTDEGDLEKFQLKASYGNETMFFENDALDKKLGLRQQKSLHYETVSGFYLNGGLDEDASPIDVFEGFIYRECVWPPRVYTHKKYVRQRTTFTFPWRDLREDRITRALSNGFTSTPDASIWNLDVHSNWPENSRRTLGSEGAWRYAYSLQFHSFGGGGTYDAQDYGILQNNYSSIWYEMGDPSENIFGQISAKLGVAPLYNRKHMITPSASVVSPNGMKIEGINSGSSIGNLDSLIDVPSGEAKWEAGSQSGLNPFYDTYDNYIQEARQYGKDYSIIPEFRISDHVSTYQSKGLSEEVADLFSLTGALENTTDSSKQNFYKIYSTSDFMKHFEMTKEDHKDFVSPNSITLKCKAVKKFLPYEGFYPAQRSVDLAQQFYNSYKDFVALSGASNPFAAATAEPYMFQNLMVPTFAPGIFFNTIKSGIAVDYPLISQNLSIGADVNTTIVKKSGDDYYIRGIFDNVRFDNRIPFEAVVEPEKHLAGYPIYCNEPHIYANNSGSVVWSGEGNALYKLMANNFLAETSEFFMKRKSFTSISSKPSNDPNVGKAIAGKTYAMRVKLYKSKDQATIPQVSSSGGFFTPPQFPSSSRETFTMYSRPSAFGPPTYLSGNNSSLIYESNMAGQGENYSFTPPYYYGEAWADITFTPTESKKYSIQEIISGSTVVYSRYAEDGTSLVESARRIHVKNNGMHLDASLNLFSQTDFVAEQSARGTGLVLPNTNDNPSRWVIQTKFETPMLNFNHLSASDSVTLPNNASQSVPRGMWHQYGRIEEDSTKGIFLQVDSIPDAWIDNYLGADSSTYESLVDLCGFSTEAVKLGQIADEKKVYEAVVAVPFVEEDGERKFFRISRTDVQNSFDPTKQSLVGESVLRMLNRMQRYVIPPPMDFLNNPTIDPFAMYIFEFSHTFKKQDLANMWQNLYPEIGQTFETQTSTLSHELLAHELLGGGAVKTPEGLLDVNAIGNEIPDRVRWMVFKVKQRAKINYYEKIVGRNDELSEATVTSQGVNVQVSYNWPYDFFSLVELAKLESEVKFAKRFEKPGQESRDTVVPIARQTPVGPIDPPPPSADPNVSEGQISQSPVVTDVPQLIQGSQQFQQNQNQIVQASVAQAGATFDQNQALLNNSPANQVAANVQSGLGPAGSVGTQIDTNQVDNLVNVNNYNFRFQG